MRAGAVSYDQFLDWCEAQQTSISKRFLRIARNQDQNNRTGHARRGFFAAHAFLLADPAMLKWILSAPGNVREPIESRDSQFLRSWKSFLRNNNGRYDILRRILPVTLGGQTVSGGGGGYPFKLALSLTADFLDSTQPTQTTIPAKYRLERKKVFDRDSGLVRSLKKKYDDCCQVCGLQIKVGRDRHYSEGHHLRPLGKDHGGSDVEGNIVILCPTHHAEFDYFLFAILDYRGRRRKLEHMCRRLAPKERNLTIRHIIDRASIDYVEDQFLHRLELHFS